MRKAESERIQWLTERRFYIGATEVAAILNIHPYSSAHSVWLSKMGLSENVSNIPMRAGTYMEGFISQEFASGNFKGSYFLKELKTRVIKSKTYRDARFPFLGCNPDREIIGIKYEGKKLRVALECKRVGHWAARNFGQDGSDQIPMQYMTQIMWQMLIGKFDLVILAALIDDREIKTYAYTFNPELSAFAHVFPKEDAVAACNFCIAWWKKHIELGQEPPLAHQDCDTQWSQSERASYDNGQLCCADEETFKVVQELAVAVKAKAEAERIETDLKNKVRQFMLNEKASEMEVSIDGIPEKFTYKTNAKGVPVLVTPFRSKNA